MTIFGVMMIAIIVILIGAVGSAYLFKDKPTWAEQRQAKLYKEMLEERDRQKKE